MDKEKIQKLSILSRLKISESEALSLSKDIGPILNYVNEISFASNLSKTLSSNNFPVRNVMRSDDVSHDSKIYTNDLISISPKNDNDYITVKRIIK